MEESRWRWGDSTKEGGDSSELSSLSHGLLEIHICLGGNDLDADGLHPKDYDSSEPLWRTERRRGGLVDLPELLVSVDSLQSVEGIHLASGSFKQLNRPEDHIDRE